MEESILGYKLVSVLPEWANEFGCSIGHYCELLSPIWYDGDGNEKINAGEIGLIDSLGIHPIYGNKIACVTFENGKRDWVSIWHLKQLDKKDPNFKEEYWIKEDGEKDVRR